MDATAMERGDLVSVERPGTTMRTAILCGTSPSVSDVFAGGPDALCERIGLQPHVGIFDLAATPPSFDPPLLQTKPSLLLVRLDLRTAKALVPSADAPRILTSDKFLRVIEGHAAAALLPEQKGA